MSYNRNEHEDLSYEYPNIISNSKTYVLPHVVVNHAVVEIYLTQIASVRIESLHHPIRHGKNCGNAIWLGCQYGIVDYNPKLIWNGITKEWLVQSYGTFLFPEIEINTLKN